MSRGFADHVNLLWFDDGLEGRNVGMSEKTFQRGLKELLAKRFIAAKDGVSFWTNPALFFKGDRVLFIKEYRRRVTSQDEKARADLESRGQMRLDPKEAAK
jgi:hypothetical protein